MIRATYSTERTRWEAKTDFDDRDVMKRAHWLWSPADYVWHTAYLDNAVQLSAYMDNVSALDVIHAFAERNTRIANSNAQNSTQALCVPEDRAYRPFQRAGIVQALERNHVLIADEMGLGKTVQAIGVINNDPSVRTVLILCPSSLKIMWTRMLQEWCVRPVYVAVGTSRKAGNVMTWGEKERPGNVVFALILNYDIMPYWRDYIDEIAWDVLVCDEAHYLKTPNSRRTQSIVGGAQDKKYNARLSYEQNMKDQRRTGIAARRRIMLTGTPILNRPIELWPLLHFLDAETWPKFWPFVQRYCGAYRDEYGWRFDGASHLDELNDKLRASVMVRRMKRDVLKELPPKERMVIPITANGAAPKIAQEHAKLQELTKNVIELQIAREAARKNRANDEAAYKASVKALQEGYKVAFEHIARERHDLALMKAPKVVEHVTDLLEGGLDKVVIFGHHNDVLDFIREGLSDYNPVHIDGRTPTNSRQSIADRFQDDASVRVFIGGIHSAGEGLTLTAASTVVFAELDWTPAKLSQAEDRCHRIGQPDSVLVQHLLYDGSLDARIAKKLLAKQAVIDKAVNIVTVEDESIDLFDLEDESV